MLPARLLARLCASLAPFDIPLFFSYMLVVWNSISKILSYSNRRYPKTYAARFCALRFMETLNKSEFEPSGFEINDCELSIAQA